jgi:hypothetical protein
MASISTLSGFTGWSGKLHPAVRRIAKIPPRPGVDGEAWVYDGWTTNADPIVTRHYCVDQAAANTDIAAARALQDGLTKSVTDPEARTWSVKVLSVVPTTAVRANGGVLLTLAWSLQVEAAP